MSALNVDAAIQWAKSNVRSRSIGKCSNYVWMAMRAGGITKIPADGRGMGTYNDYWHGGNAVCLTMGFRELGHWDTQEACDSNYKPAAGDVMTYYGAQNPNCGTSYRSPIMKGGYHTTWFTGSQWLSDFTQRSAYVYKGCHHITVYRHESISGSATSVSGSDIITGVDAPNDNIKTFNNDYLKSLGISSIIGFGDDIDGNADCLTPLDIHPDNRYIRALVTIQHNLIKEALLDDLYAEIDSTYVEKMSINKLVPKHTSDIKCYETVKYKNYMTLDDSAPCEGAIPYIQQMILDASFRISGVGDINVKGENLNNDIIEGELNIHMTKKQNRKIEYIVIHYTAGHHSKAGAARNCINAFTARPVSADFAVDDSEIVQFNKDMENQYCWAIGDALQTMNNGGSLHGKAVNENSIHIEICSNIKSGFSTNYPNHEGWFFTKESLLNAAKLVKSLINRYKIPMSNIIRHYDATGKLCPGIIGWNDGFINKNGTVTSEKSNSDAWNEFKIMIQNIKGNMKILDRNTTSSNEENVIQKTKNNTSTPYNKNAKSVKLSGNAANNEKAFEDVMMQYGGMLGLNNMGKALIIAQVMHESGNFKWMAELGKGKGKKYGNPTGPYNQVYYGRGPIQVTWYDNYKKIYDNFFCKNGLSQYDIVKNPDLALDPKIGSLLTLGWFTLPGNGKRAIAAANAGNVKSLSKAINGGYNGLQDRQNNTISICKKLGVTGYKLND